MLPDKGQDISLDGFNLRINMVLGNTLVATAILVCYSFPVRDFIAVGMPIAEHPPQQIPASVIHAPGSHLGWLTANPMSSFAYTVEPLGHVYPAQCPVRVLLSHVSLGPLPWLHQLRPQSPRFVRRLQCYYEEV